MNMVEVAYQVRNTAQVLVGSQEVEPADGWPYHTVLRELAKNPAMTPAKLGKVIVDRYLASYNPNEGVTQSALDLSASTKLEGAIDKLASALLKELPAEATQVAVMRARRAARSYETHDYIDLVHFCQLLRKFGASAAVQAACSGVEDTAAKSFVLAVRVQGRERVQLERRVDLLPRERHLAAVREAGLREEQQVERAARRVPRRGACVSAARGPLPPRRERDLFVLPPARPRRRVPGCRYRLAP